MAQKITDLTAYTLPQPTDVFPIVDISNGETKKITYANIEANLDRNNQSETLTVLNGGTGVTSIAAFEPLLTLDNLTGTLALAKGGTGLTTIAAGSIYAANALDTLTAINSTSGKKRLTNDSGTISWDTDPTILTLYPGHMDKSATVTSHTIDTNTVAHIHLFNVPTRIVLNTATLNILTHTSAGESQVAIYSEDGQTQLADVTSDTSAATGPLSTTFSALTLEAGNYWILTVPVATTNWTVATLNPAGSADELVDLTGMPVVSGTLTVTAGTAPATIDPTAVDADSVHDEAIIYRFDN